MNKELGFGNLIINNETIKYCSLCDRVVSGSYIISSDNFSERIDTLR